MEWIQAYGKPVIAVLNCRNQHWRLPPREELASQRKSQSQAVHQHEGNIRDGLTNLGLSGIPVVSISAKRALMARGREPFKGPDAKTFAKHREEFGTEALLKWSSLDGAFTNNIIIPHVQFRWLPNELDFLVLQEGYVYVIDAKELDAGWYRGAPDGPWEYSPDGVIYQPLTVLTHPWVIAFKKGRALESYIQELHKQKADPPAMPTVVSVIVVPDHAEVSGLGWREHDARTTTGIRLLLTRLSRLPDMIAQDLKTFRQRRPKVEELVDLLSIRSPNDTKALPCRLDEHLEIVEKMGESTSPIALRVYRGYQHLLRAPVRVEMIRKLAIPSEGAQEPYERKARALRSYFRSCDKVVHPAMLRLLSTPIERPSDFVLISEFFSQEDLMDYVRRKPLSWEVARQIFAPVVDLLRQAHAKGVVHRYLDPACILIRDGSPPEVRVHGFFGALIAGCSRVSPGSAEGNPYMAPEFDTAEDADAHWLDVFSLGRCITTAIMGAPLGSLGLPLVPEEAARVVEQLTAIIPRDRAEGWARLPALLAT